MSKETVEHGEESWSLGREASDETPIEEGLESRLNGEFLMFTFRDVPPKMYKSVRNPRKGPGTHFSKYGGKLGHSLAVATAGIHPGARGKHPAALGFSPATFVHSDLLPDGQRGGGSQNTLT